MANRIKEKDEYLEKLWEMKEKGQDSLLDLSNGFNGGFEGPLLDELAIEGLVNYLQDNKTVTLTENGTNQARKIIRAHRIGERLLYDVFGGDFEKGACEFEHTYTVELIDGICTLLGHPKECPHGMPIPEGDCCKMSAKAAHNLVIPLKDLEIGQSARVAYINCRDDCHMHKLDGLQIRPGRTIKLHQRYPCFVVECENSSIAIDDEIAENICVWTKNPKFEPARYKTSKNKNKNKNFWNFLKR